MGQDKKVTYVPVDLMQFTPEERAFKDDVVIKAQQGDQAADRELKKPCNARLAAKCAAMEEMIKQLICKSACGEVNAVAVAMYRKMEAIAGDLAGISPSAVEAMLANLAAIAWGDFMRCAMHRETQEGCTFRAATYYDQRADRAHKRLVRSLRALAAVRKVDLTAVQINLHGVAGQIDNQPSRSAHHAEESLVDEPIPAN